MFGVAKCAFLIWFAGYMTMALPLERNRRRIEPLINMAVLQQGTPCETKAQMGDTIKITLSTFRQTGDEVERSPDRNMQVTLGDQFMPSLEEAMVGMCPGEIRRVSVTHPTRPGSQGFTVNYDMELISIGAGIPPEIDTNGDNTLDRDEVANYLAQVYGDQAPDEAAFEIIFNGIDTNGNGVIDLNEWQEVSD